MKNLILASLLASASIAMAAPLGEAIQLSTNPTWQNTKLSDPPYIVREKDGTRWEVRSVYDPACKCVKLEKTQVQ